MKAQNIQKVWLVVVSWRERFMFLSSMRRNKEIKSKKKKIKKGIET